MAGTEGGSQSVVALPTSVLVCAACQVGRAADGCRDWSYCGPHVASPHAASHTPLFLVAVLYPYQYEHEHEHALRSAVDNTVQYHRLVLVRRRLALKCSWYVLLLLVGRQSCMAYRRYREMAQRYFTACGCALTGGNSAYTVHEYLRGMTRTDLNLF